jgi:hypothetical protein
MLAEISIVGEPAYPTAAWLSDPDLMDDMPGHAQALRRLWSEPGRDTAAALRAMASRAPRKPAARPHRAATSALSDAYPAGFGFSSAELGKLAMLDGAARRYNKAVAALRFERQRETNRARRNTRRAA